MRKYNIARYRRIDAAIRYNDGIKDIALKIKQKCVDLIKGFANTFSKLPLGRKIVFLLGNLARIAGAIIVGTGVGPAVKAVKEAKETYAQLNRLIDEQFSSSSILETAEGSYDYDASIAPFSTFLKAKGFVKPAIKVIGGLVMVLAGTVSSTIASAK